MVDGQEEYLRMVDKSQVPTEAVIKRYIGKFASDAWLKLRQFIVSNYEPLIETKFWGVKYGWMVRFRKAGRTLCMLFPEAGAFSVLIVLGKKESQAILSKTIELTSRIYDVIKETKQLHDGRWVWIRVMSNSDLVDIQKVLQVKRKPGKRTRS